MCKHISKLSKLGPVRITHFLLMYLRFTDGIHVYIYAYVCVQIMYLFGIHASCIGLNVNLSCKTFDYLISNCAVVYK